jgi:hypothetical protein
MLPQRGNSIKLNTIDHAIANDRRSFLLIAIFAAAGALVFTAAAGHGHRVREEHSTERQRSAPIDAAGLHDLNANQIAMTTSATTMVAHTAGVTRFELPLRGESLAAWSNSIWTTSSTKADLRKMKVDFPQIYRNTARILSHSDRPCRSPSCFDGDGCTELTGSEAGKLSIRPASSFAWRSRSANAASRGLTACLSCAEGSNFSAMLSLHRKITPARSGRSPPSAECRWSFAVAVAAAGIRRHRKAGLPQIRKRDGAGRTSENLAAWSILHRQMLQLLIDYISGEIAPSSLR